MSEGETNNIELESRIVRIGRYQLLVLALLFVAVTTAIAATVRCGTCGRVVQGRYIKSGNKVYCSRQCYEKTLPTCAVCGKRLTGKYMRQEGRNFCSQKCLDTTLPKCELCGKPLQGFIKIKGHMYCMTHGNGPRCDACGLPLVKGQQLPDKRVLCERCAKHVILDLRDAQAVYQRAQLEVEKITGFSLKEPPPMEMVGRDKMPGMLAGADMEDVQERGYYRRQEKTDTYSDSKGKVVRVDREVKENIYILYGLTPEELLCTASHELTHAVQARFLPAIHEKAPLWLKEGLCQYVAATVAKRHRYAGELTSIEKSPHPAYGRGYRYLKDRFGNGNWQAVLKWVRTLKPSQLPKELPEDL